MRTFIRLLSIYKARPSFVVDFTFASLIAIAVDQYKYCGVITI